MRVPEPAGSRAGGHLAGEALGDAASRQIVVDALQVKGLRLATARSFMIVDRSTPA
jgi:hypothetical protein